MQPEVRLFEPRVATCDSGDGFRYIRRICEVAREKLRREGLLFMEIGYNQGSAIAAIAQEAGLTTLEIYADYEKIPRVFKASPAAASGRAS